MGVISLPYLSPFRLVNSAPPARMTRHTGGGNKESLIKKGEIMKKLVNKIKDTLSVFPSSEGFTLLELLVVVLIIGILVAIALPRYQRVVWRARLHQGMALVESLYEAQQYYYLTYGNFATDIDDLILSVPMDESCIKTQNSSHSHYECGFGRIGMSDDLSNVQFINTTSEIAYMHMLKDFSTSTYQLREGKRYCFADEAIPATLFACESIGGVLILNTHRPGVWVRFEIQ